MNKSTANVPGIICPAFWSMDVAVTRHMSGARVLGMPAVPFPLSGCKKNTAG